MTTVTVLAGLTLALAAGPALAHVEVSADKTTAGARDVTLTFHGEAENDQAGIASERVVLPEGIAPASVTLVKAPAGWTFRQNPDGFTVSGKALRIGADAEWKVKIAKLPEGETRLSFKTVETYGNGDVSRWIEIQEPGQPEPDNPAPLVTLKPGPKAPAAPSGAAPSTAPPSTAATTSTPSLAPAASADEADGGSSKAWIWIVVALAAAGAVVFLLARRRRTP
nr:DUF1775 domain-containing protein [uncultured Actinoplanes sp.]